VHLHSDSRAWFIDISFAAIFFPVGSAHPMDQVLRFVLLYIEKRDFKNVFLVSKLWFNESWKNLFFSPLTYVQIFNYESHQPPPTWHIAARLLHNRYFDMKRTAAEHFKTSCFFGHVGICRYLLEFSSSLDPSHDDQWAIRFASTNGQTQVVELLLAQPAVDPTAHSCFALHGAAANGHTAVASLLLQDGRIDPASRGNYAIQLACLNGHYDTVCCLLQDPRVDPSDYNNHCIRQAARNGHLQVVRRLVQDPRVDASAQQCYALRYAAAGGHLGLVKELISLGVDPTAGANWAVGYAHLNGHAHVVQELLKLPGVTPRGYN
jgi:hypothetical protein